MQADLNDKQQRFIELFFDRDAGAFLVAAKAARLAGYSHPSKQGHRLMQNPLIHKEVVARFTELILGTNRPEMSTFANNSLHTHKKTN